MVLLLLVSSSLESNYSLELPLHVIVGNTLIGFGNNEDLFLLYSCILLNTFMLVYFLIFF